MQLLTRAQPDQRRTDRRAALNAYASLHGDSHAAAQAQKLNVRSFRVATASE